MSFYNCVTGTTVTLDADAYSEARLEDPGYDDRVVAALPFKLNTQNDAEIQGSALASIVEAIEAKNVEQLLGQGPGSMPRNPHVSRAASEWPQKLLAKVKDAKIGPARLPDTHGLNTQPRSLSHVERDADGLVDFDDIGRPRVSVPVYVAPCASKPPIDDLSFLITGVTDRPMGTLVEHAFLDNTDFHPVKFKNGATAILFNPELMRANDRNSFIFQFKRWLATQLEGLEELDANGEYRNYYFFLRYDTGSAPGKSGFDTFAPHRLMLYNTGEEPFQILGEVRPRPDPEEEQPSAKRPRPSAPTGAFPTDARQFIDGIDAAHAEQQMAEAPERSKVAGKILKVPEVRVVETILEGQRRARAVYLQPDGEDFDFGDTEAPSDFVGDFSERVQRHLSDAGATPARFRKLDEVPSGRPHALLYLTIVEKKKLDDGVEGLEKDLKATFEPAERLRYKHLMDLFRRESDTLVPKTLLTPAEAADGRYDVKGDTYYALPSARLSKNTAIQDEIVFFSVNRPLFRTFRTWMSDAALLRHDRTGFERVVTTWTAQFNSDAVKQFEVELMAFSKRLETTYVLRDRMVHSAVYLKALERLAANQVPILGTDLALGRVLALLLLRELALLGEFEARQERAKATMREGLELLRWCKTTPPSDQIAKGDLGAVIEELQDDGGQSPRTAAGGGFVEFHGVVRVAAANLGRRGTSRAPRRLGGVHPIAGRGAGPCGRETVAGASGHRRLGETVDRLSASPSHLDVPSKDRSCRGCTNSEDRDGQFRRVVRACGPGLYESTRLSTAIPDSRWIVGARCAGLRVVSSAVAVYDPRLGGFKVER